VVAAIEAAYVEEYAALAEVALQSLLQQLCVLEIERTPVIDENTARHGAPP
jgi:hypothetical protein